MWTPTPARLQGTAYMQRSFLLSLTFLFEGLPLKRMHQPLRAAKLSKSDFWLDLKNLRWGVHLCHGIK